MDQEPGDWSLRFREALVREIEDRAHDRGELLVRQVEARDAHTVEIAFAARYLQWREVVMIVDGRRAFADDFLLDEVVERGVPLESLELQDVAWRVYLLGMHEPFSPADLTSDRGGDRPIREIQDDATIK